MTDSRVLDTFLCNTMKFPNAAVEKIPTTTTTSNLQISMVSRLLNFFLCITMIISNVVTFSTDTSERCSRSFLACSSVETFHFVSGITNSFVCFTVNPRISKHTIAKVCIRSVNACAVVQTWITFAFVYVLFA